MSRQKDKGRLDPFVPVDLEVMGCPAWRATSHGARWLYIHLKRRWSYKQGNNGRLYLSQRDAVEEIGASRESIGRWYRELRHYGFVVMTNPGSLGVDGKGLAPHWRLTELPAAQGNTLMLPTKDYLRWNGTRFQDERGVVKRARKKQKPGLHIRARVASKYGPGLDYKYRPVPSESGLHIQAIENDPPGLHIQAISRYTTPSPFLAPALPSLRYTLSDSPEAFMEYFGRGGRKYVLSDDPRAFQHYATNNLGRFQ